jgi:hypothetical protein
MAFKSSCLLPNRSLAFRGCHCTIVCCGLIVLKKSADLALGLWWSDKLEQAIHSQLATYPASGCAAPMM